MSQSESAATAAAVSAAVTARTQLQASGLSTGASHCHCQLGEQLFNRTSDSGTGIRRRLNLYASSEQQHSDVSRATTTINYLDSVVNSCKRRLRFVFVLFYLVAILDPFFYTFRRENGNNKNIHMHVCCSRCVCVQYLVACFFARTPLSTLLRAFAAESTRDKSNTETNRHTHTHRPAPAANDALPGNDATLHVCEPRSMRICKRSMRE